MASLDDEISRLENTHDVTFAPKRSIVPGRSRLAAATCRSGLDALTLANLHGGLVVDGGRSHTLLDLSCHCQESLLDVGRVLGRCLEEGDSKAIGELL